MFLHRLFLDQRCKEARRDLADPYQMHSTLCRAFSEPEKQCEPGAFLWRLEPERDSNGFAKVLVQSRDLPDWSRINLVNWFGEEASPPIDIVEKLKLASLENGWRFRYRLRANPSVCRKGKRLGLLDSDPQDKWLCRQGEKDGFKPITIHRSDERMLSGNDRKEHHIRVFSVLYDGVLEVTDPQAFRKSIATGIGRAKSLGLGLLSVVSV